MENKIKLKTNEILRKKLNSAGLEVIENLYLEMNSDRDLIIKGVCEVKEYTDNMIFLITEKYCIELKGTNFVIKVFSLPETVISGDVENIAFLKK